MACWRLQKNVRMHVLLHHVFVHRHRGTPLVTVPLYSNSERSSYGAASPAEKRDHIVFVQALKKVPFLTNVYKVGSVHGLYKR